MKVDPKDWQYFVGTRASFRGGLEMSRMQKKKNRILKSRLAAQSRGARRQEEGVERQPYLARLVRVPLAALLKEWTGMDNKTYVDHNECSDSARLSMKNVSDKIKHLRTCLTVNALQKKNLQVATALLEVVTHRECHNPFLCLQQAAMFAAQGPKGGKNDEAFRKLLPEETECTPVEALTILGRADCMRAVYFPEEAMFLCAFVARVCSFHRDPNDSQLPWTSKWRAVSAYTYMTSVSIDSTITSLINGGYRNMTSLDPWDTTTKEEISRGRRDAIDIKREGAQRVKTNSRNLRVFESKLGSHIHSCEPDKRKDKRDNNEGDMAMNCDNYIDDEGELEESSDQEESPKYDSSEHNAHNNSDASILEGIEDNMNETELDKSHQGADVTEKEGNSMYASANGACIQDGADSLFDSENGIRKSQQRN